MKKLMSLFLIITILTSGAVSASALTIGDEKFNVYNETEPNKNYYWYTDYLKMLKQERGVTYTSAELKELENTILYYINNRNSMEFSQEYFKIVLGNIVSVNLRDDDEYNCIEIVMKDLNPLSMELFGEYISDSDAIIFWGKGDYSVDNFHSFTVKSGSTASRIKIKSGKTVKIPIANKSKVKRWKSSNSKVISVKNGKITARQKGKATVTAIYGSAFEVRLNYTVEDDPKLTSNGKKVTSVKVKKGKTKKLKLTGKASEYNNKYTNTKRATITSKKTSKTIKIKGLKKGTTTLKILVNKVKTLKIKVKVTK